MKEFVKELKDFIATPYDKMVEGFVKPYTEGAPLPEAMWEDFGPLFFNREDFIPPQLWLGAVPTHIPTSSFHRDPHTGFLLQVIGRKRLDLYSADPSRFIISTQKPITIINLVGLNQKNLIITYIRKHKVHNVYLSHWNQAKLLYNRQAGSIRCMRRTAPICPSAIFGVIKYKIHVM